MVCVYVSELFQCCTLTSTTSAFRLPSAVCASLGKFLSSSKCSFLLPDLCSMKRNMVIFSVLSHTIFLCVRYVIAHCPRLLSHGTLEYVLMACHSASYPPLSLTQQQDQQPWQLYPTSDRSRPVTMVTMTCHHGNPS